MDCQVHRLLCVAQVLPDSSSLAAGGERRPMVEFAIENALVLHKRSARNARAGNPTPACSACQLGLLHALRLCRCHEICKLSSCAHKGALPMPTALP